MNGTRSAIITYHSLDDSGAVISVPPARFLQHVDFLMEQSIPVAPLSDLQSRPGSVALTFDDGYRSVLTHALPVLQRYRLPATVFVVTGHCGGRNDWSLPSRKLPWLDVMDWAELRELTAAGVELGAHTVRHPNLSLLSDEQLHREFSQCRAELENHLRCRVDSLAYPYGVSSPKVREVARQYFRLACGTGLDFVDASSDPFDLPRLDAYYIRRQFCFEEVMSGDRWNYIWARRLVRGLRRIS